MEESRRLQALAAYAERARAFDEIARRRRRFPTLLAVTPAPAREASPARPRLSRRGREVLALLAEGYDNKEIARRLHVGPETVKTHVRNVLVALNARNRAHAVAIAFRSGLLGETEPTTASREQPPGEPGAGTHAPRGRRETSVGPVAGS